MLKLAVLLALVAVALAAPAADDFAAFKAQFGKTYSSRSEEAARRSLFLRNKHEMDAHNARFAAGKETYTRGINQFSDLSHEEFKETYLMRVPPSTSDRERNEVFLPTDDLPNETDWRTKGAVTPVKNQGYYCDSCWAFATTGTLEGAVQIATGKLISLSEQQLMDCSYPEANRGCVMGLSSDALTYVIKNGGLAKESDYVYKAVDEECKTSKEAHKAISITGQVAVPKSEAQLMAAVAKGPVSVCIRVNGNYVAYYGGIFNGECDSTSINHCALVVGYGNDKWDGTPYWLVKNPFGWTWGDYGYIMIERGRNLCGIYDDAVYPTGASISSASAAVL